ncbi:hypothetical protein Tco_1339022, partial [Tanacetum coccineum]
VALTKCHSTSSKLQVKMDKKALIEQCIMSPIGAVKRVAHLFASPGVVTPVKLAIPSDAAPYLGWRILAVVAKAAVVAIFLAKVVVEKAVVAPAAFAIKLSKSFIARVARATTAFSTTAFARTVLIMLL